MTTRYLKRIEFFFECVLNCFFSKFYNVCLKVMAEISHLATKRIVTKTTLQKEIDRFVWIIATIALSIVIITLVAYVAWIRHSHPDFIDWPQMIVQLISLLVAFIPEGMPICVTITLSIIGKKMARAKVLVRNLSIIETLGVVNVILSDKTGTLTQNKMIVKSVGQGATLDPDSPLMKKLAMALALCNNAGPESEEDADLPLHLRELTGSASDIAIFKWCSERMNLKEVIQSNSVIADIPFNSRNKYMLTIHKAAPGEGPLSGGKFLIMKGASERMIDRCDRICEPDGKIIQLDHARKEELKQIIEKAANRGERVLGVAYHTLDEHEYPDDYFFDTAKHNFPMEDLIFLGLTALFDPPRITVPPAIETLRGASVRVKMVTGDHPGTAASIARQVGIISPHSKIENMEHLNKYIEQNITEVDTGGDTPINDEDEDDEHTHLLGGGRFSVFLHTFLNF